MGGIDAWSALTFRGLCVQGGLSGSRLSPGDRDREGPGIEPSHQNRQFPGRGKDLGLVTKSARGRGVLREPQVKVSPGSPGAGRPVSLAHVAVSICAPSPAGAHAGPSPGLGLTGPRGPRSSQLRPGRGLTQGTGV